MMMNHNKNDIGTTQKPEYRKRPLVTAVQNALLASGLMAFQSGVLAGPENGVVTRGIGDITRPNADTTMIKQQSQKLSIDWQSFNVATHEQVQFNQPNAQSVALNRILDQNASQIHGRIDANGQVFLMNPNGLVFGKTAAVNVSSLVATTLMMSNEDFMAGHWSFTEAETHGVVVNRGLIEASTGGYVTLLGNSVVNHGVIKADLGTVNLASGSAATMDFDGDGLISFVVTDETLVNADGSEAAVLNAGQIEANGGDVLLTARAASDVFKNAVNNTGIVEARGASLAEDGTVVLGDGSSGSVAQERQGAIRLDGGDGDIVVNGGALDASSDSGQGGKVDVTGSRVGLFGDAVVDVSGETGGGTARIGGEFQGGNGSPDELASAAQTVVGANAKIDASAGHSGEGGEVIVWSDDHTVFNGAISVAGGSESGDGGFVEISSSGYMDLTGSVDASAPNGVQGQVLLDPDDIEVVVTGGGAAASDVDQFADAGNDPNVTQIDPATLDALDASVTLQAHNDITFTDALDISDVTADFTAQAGDDIFINASITVASDSTLTLSAGDGGATPDSADGTADITGTGQLSGGSISLTAPGVINISGNLTAPDNDPGTDSVVQTISVSGDSGVTVDGDISGLDADVTLASSGGNVNIGSGSITLADTDDSGSLIINAVDTIFTGGTTLTVSTIGVIAPVDINSTGNVDFGGLNVGGSGGIGTFTVDFAGTLDLSGTSGGTLGSAFAGTRELTGTGSNDTIIGPASGTTYTISNSIGDGVDDGDILTFDFLNVENLIGSLGNDTFKLQDNASLTGSIDAAGGSDTLDMSLVGASITVTAAASTNDGVAGSVSSTNLTLGGGFDNINTITAPGTGSTLQGSTGSDTFTTSGVDTGTISVASNASYSGFDNLGGGDGNDIFNLGNDLTGSVSGGGGDDTFNVNASIDTSLAGDGGDDSFVLANGVTLTGTIDGGAEAGVTGDTLDLSAFTGTTSVTVTGAGSVDGVAGTNANVTGGFDSINILTGSLATSTLTGANSAASWSITGADSGTFTDAASSQSLSFSGFDELAGGTANDDFTIASGGSVSGSIAGGGTGTDMLTFDNDGNTITVTGSGAGNATDATFTAIEDVFGGTGADTFELASTATINVNAGDGADTINLSAAITGTVTGGAAGDIVNLDAGGSATTLSGGSAAGNDTDNDTLTFPDATQTINVTGTDSGDLGGGQAFTEFENLTGGNADDSFGISGSLTGVIDGGDGNDQASYASLAGPVTVTLGTDLVNVEEVVGSASNGDDVLAGVTNASVTGEETGSANGTVAFSSFENLQGTAGDDTFTVSASGRVSGSTGISGNGGNDVLTSTDPTTNTFTVTAIDAGTVQNSTGVTNFTDVDNLTGGTGDDTFTLGSSGSLSGTIDGVSGTADTIDISLVTAAQTVDVGAGTVTDVGSFVNIDTVTGDGTTDVLANDNAITLTGVNDGTTGAGLAFVNFSNIKGTTARDIFTINDGGSVTGSIDGLGGTDDIDVSAITAAQTLDTQASSLTSVVSFASIESVIGDNTNDVLTGSTVNVTGVNDGTSDGVEFTDFVSVTGTTGTDSFTLDATGQLSGAGFDGNGGADTLAAIDTSGNTFTVTSTDSGTVTNTAGTTSFADVDNLTGGTGADIFVLGATGSVSGTIDGVNDTSTDTIDYSAQAGETVDVSGGTSDSVGALTNIDAVVGGDTGTTVAFALTGVAEATITNGNDGSVDNGALTFTDFGSITGSSADNTFTLNDGASIQEIAGGGSAGADTIDVSPQNALQTLDTQLGSVTSVASFTAIDTIIGDDTQDVVTGNVVSVTGINDGTSDGVGFTNFVAARGTTGTDTFTLNATGQLTGAGFDGNGGTDTLTATDASGNTFTLTSADGGTVTNVTTGTTSFADVDNLTGGAGTDAFDLNGGTLTGAIDGAGGTNKLTLDDVANTIAVTTLDAGSATGIDGGFANINGTITGGSSTDAFDLNGGTLTGSVDGAGGTNTLTLDDVANTVTVTGLNAGSATGIDGGFANINGTIAGGSSTDAFDVNGGTLTGSIDGAGGINTLTLDDVANTVTVTGADAGTATGIDGTFSNIASITGGSDDDAFVMSDGSSISGTLDGAGHNNGDELDLSAQSVSQTVDVAAGTATSVNAWVNIEIITNNGGSLTNANHVTVDGTDSGTADGLIFSGVADISGTTGDDTIMLTVAGLLSGTGYDGNGGTDTLTGTDTSGHIFSIANPDAGSVQNSAGTTSFTDVNNLTGDSGVDTFTIGSAGALSGVIDGGQGSDMLRHTDGTNTFAITGSNAGTVDGVGSFTSIENLTGGTGDDTFDFANNSSLSGTVDGDMGVDSLNLAGVGAATSVTIDGDGSVISGLAGTVTSDNVTITNGFDNIDDLVGSGLGTSELTGSVNADEFTTSSNNAGTIVHNASESATYGGFVNLSGGDGGDTFNLANDVTGAVGVSGNTGDDTFNVNASMVANLGGGAGDDLFSISDGVTLTGSIDAGQQDTIGDQLDLSQSASATNVSITGDAGLDGLEGSTAAVTGGFTNVNVVSGSGAPGSTLTGSTGVDRFDITATNAGTITLTNSATFSGFDSLAGNDGTDRFHLASGGSLSGGLDGGADTDTLTKADGTNLFGITGTDAGSVSTGSPVASFSNIQNLIGGTGSDTFDFGDNTSLSGAIDGGDGTDTVDLADVGAVTDVMIAADGTGDGLQGFLGSDNVTLGGRFDNVDALTASANHGGTLTGSAGADTLATTGTDSGTLTITQSATWSNFTDLDGAGGTDTFNVGHDVTGSIDGGAGTDTLNITAGHNAGTSFDVTVEIIDDTGTNTVTTPTVSFDGVTSLGQSEDRIDINADNLTMTNGAGDIFLDEADSIEVTSVAAGTGAFDLTAGTDVTIGTITSGSTVSIAAAAGSINDAVDDTSTDITAAGLITLTAQDEIGGSPGAIEVADSSTVDASSTGAGAIMLAGKGQLTLQDLDTADGNIIVNADSQITATDVAASDAVSMTANTGDVSLGDVAAGTALNITATSGNITDTIGATVHAGELASLIAASTIVLGDDASDTVNFGSLDVTAPTVMISEDSGTSLVGVDATDLVLNSAGHITDTATATISVSGNADLSVTDNTTGDIILGDDTGDSLTLGTVTVNARDLDLTEDSDLEFAGTNTVTGALTAMATGTITDAPGTTLTVSGMASLDSGGNSITLGDDGTDTTNFGSLNVSGSTVTIVEDSDTSLVNVDATDLVLNSSGHIMDTATATINVSGNADLSVTDNTAGDIVLGDDVGDSLALGTVTVNARDLDLTEDSHLEFTGTNTVTGALTARAAGTITDAAGTTLAVSGMASLDGGANSITLGDDAGDTTNFGSLNVTGETVTVTEDSGTHLAGVDATNLVLNSAGHITDTATAAINVGGNANLSVTDNTTGDIVLGEDAGDSLALGTVTVNARDVNLTEQGSGTEFAGTNVVVGALTVTSMGAITQGGPITVGGTMTLDTGGTTPGTNDITLGNATNDFNTVAILAAGDASLSDINAITLDDVTLSGHLDLVAGSSADLSNTRLTTGSVDTAGDVTLGLNNSDSPVGALTITNADNVNDSAPNYIDTLDITASGNVNLDEDNQFADNTVIFDIGGTLNLNDVDELSIQGAAGSDVTVRAPNSITVSDTLMSGGEIRLITARTNLNGAVTTEGGDVTVSSDQTNISSDISTQGGSVSLENQVTLAANILTQGGAVSIGGNLTAESSEGQISRIESTTSDGSGNAGALTVSGSITGNALELAAGPVTLQEVDLDDSLLLQSTGGDLIIDQSISATTSLDIRADSITIPAGATDAGLSSDSLVVLAGGDIQVGNEQFVFSGDTQLVVGAGGSINGSINLQSDNTADLLVGASASSPFLSRNSNTTADVTRFTNAISPTLNPATQVVEFPQLIQDFLTPGVVLDFAAELAGTGLSTRPVSSFQTNQVKSTETEANADVSAYQWTLKEMLLPIEPPGIRLPGDDEEDEDEELAGDAGSTRGDAMLDEITFTWPKLEIPEYGRWSLFDFGVGGTQGTQRTQRTQRTLRDG